MRLLIGSDTPSSLGEQLDVRSWTQRLLWFAEDGDAIVLMDEPDPAFVDHVTERTGVDPLTLRIHIMPSRWIGGNFDAWSLLDSDFQHELSVDAAAADEVVALWPSAEVGWLVSSLGIEHKLPGAAFLREGGGAMANSKVLFRALAATAGVAVPLGGVCRSADEAFHLSGHLLRAGDAFVVKRSYGGGGTGNEIASTKPLAVSHSGHAGVEVVEPTPTGLRSYWDRRWAWASNGGHPVVLEEYIADARTLYAEVMCGDDGIGAPNIGELQFEAGRIAREVFPAQDVPERVLSRLREGGGSLG